MNLNSDLLYRFGFIISNKDKKIGIPENWFYEKISNNLFLYRHYECKVKNIQFESKSIFVLGDIFVSHGNKTLLDNLNELSDSSFSSLDNLSGRFVIIYICGNTIRFFNDSFGAKSVYYTNSYSDFFVVSSHASLIASHLNLSIDIDTKKYKKSEEYQSKGTRFLPGNLTMYKEIYALSPNHYLNLDKIIQRFWPVKPITSTSFDDLVILWREYFYNFINYCKESGYRPVFGLTGGVDTRAVIAAFKNNLEFNTFTWSRGINDKEKNIISDLSSYLKIDNTWIDLNINKQGSNFELHREISNINTSFSRTKSSLTAQISLIAQSNDIFIRGLGGEILRGMFNYANSKSKKEKIEYAIYLYNGYVLNSKIRSSFYDNFTNSAIEKFFEINDFDSIEKINVDVGDLVYWEQRMGMWAANQMLETDSAIKSFVGINSRKIYECAYGLSDEQRFNKSLLIKLVNLCDVYLSKIEFC